MKATVVGWKMWELGKVKAEYPMLTIEASKSEVKATEALCRLDTICKGLSGLGYKQSLVSINNTDRHQRTNFVIDVGTLLTLCAQIQTKPDQTSFATAWLQSLADSYNAKAATKVNEQLRCRCGQVFKNIKVKRKHLKSCSVIQRDIKLLRRVKESLARLSGKKVANGNEKSKGRKLGHPKSKDVHAKGPVRKSKKRAKGTA